MINKLILAVTTRPTVHGEANNKVTIPGNVSVCIVPASNLPVESPIDYWVERFLPSTENSIELDNETLEILENIRRTIGIGLNAEDVEWI